MTAVLGLCISLIALLVSMTALLIAKRQLDEARTANGGRGLSLEFHAVAPGDLSPEQYALVNRSLEGMSCEYVVFQMTFKVRGSAHFFDVIPYTWGEAGNSDPFGNARAIDRLTCDDGAVSTLMPIQRELVPGIKLGLAWTAPWREGLAPAALRTDLDGNLEEWVWRGRFISMLLPSAKKGRWRAVQSPAVSWGPLSQPWELSSGRRVEKQQGDRRHAGGQYPVWSAHLSREGTHRQQ